MQYSTPFSTFKVRESGHGKYWTDPDVPGIQMVLCLPSRQEKSFSKWNQMIKDDLVPFHNLVIRKPGETVDLDGIDTPPNYSRSARGEGYCVPRTARSSFHLRYTAATEPQQTMQVGPLSLLEQRISHQRGLVGG
jgi:hypothetical protein